MVYLALWHSGLVGGQLSPSTNKKNIIKLAKKTASFYNFNDGTTYWRVFRKDDGITIAAGGVTASGRKFKTL